MNGKSQKTSKIKVAVRKRPLSSKEKSRNEHDIINVENSTVMVSETKYIFKYILIHTDVHR